MKQHFMTFWRFVLLMLDYRLCLPSRGKDAIFFGIICFMVLVLLWDGFVFKSSYIVEAISVGRMIMFSMASMALGSAVTSVNVMLRYHASVHCMEKSCFANNTSIDPS